MMRRQRTKWSFRRRAEERRGGGVLLQFTTFLYSTTTHYRTPLSLSLSLSLFLEAAEKEVRRHLLVLVTRKIRFQCALLIAT